MRNKIAIITSIFGGYEKLNPHTNVINKDKVDWYCFTDDPTKHESWQIITTPYHILNMEDNHDKYIPYKNYYANVNDMRVINMMSAKYYKTQAHHIDILQSYEYYIWIDGNISLRDNFVDHLIQLFESNPTAELFVYKHREKDGYPDRTSITEEVSFCKDWDKYNTQDLDGQLQAYKTNGFQDDMGLFQLGVFYRRNNQSINNVYDLWWEHNLKYSYQDQVSFPYVLWKSKKMPDFTIDKSIWNNEEFYVTEHYNACFY
jgi:O-antigen biosynthesis protein